MKSYRYEELTKLSSQELSDLAKLNGFAIIAKADVEERIVRFLENESRYRNSSRRLRDRLHYLLGGRHGFAVIPFVTLWNSAKINGLDVAQVCRGTVRHFIFSRTTEY